MTKTIIQFLLIAIVLILMQILCSKILLFNVATPIVFIYLILRLPINMHVNWTMIIAFTLGLIIDTFGNTQGMNALACTMLATLRHPVFNAYQTREDDMNSPMPSIRSLGFATYFKYAATLTLLYCIIIFLIQAFTLRHLGLTMMRIVASSVISIIFIVAFDSLVSTRREKRL